MARDQRNQLYSGRITIKTVRTSSTVIEPATITVQSIPSTGTSRKSNSQRKTYLTVVLIFHKVIVMRRIVSTDAVIGNLKYENIGVKLCDNKLCSKFRLTWRSSASSRKGSVLSPVISAIRRERRGKIGSILSESQAVLEVLTLETSCTAPDFPCTKDRAS